MVLHTSSISAGFFIFKATTLTLSRPASIFNFWALAASCCFNSAFRLVTSFSLRLFITVIDRLVIESQIHFLLHLLFLLLFPRCVLLQYHNLSSIPILFPARLVLL